MGLISVIPKTCAATKHRSSTAIIQTKVLPKSGDLTNPGNWRPITQTCIPAKLLEKVIQTRLMKFLLQNGYINDDQFGFVPNRSTQLAVMETVCDLYHAMNSNLITGLLFLDVRKAFDSLNHMILIDKLKKLGLDNSILKWFNSYLDRNRRSDITV